MWSSWRRPVDVTGRGINQITEIDEEEIWCIASSGVQERAQRNEEIYNYFIIISCIYLISVLNDGPLC